MEIKGAIVEGPVHLELGTVKGRVVVKHTTFTHPVVLSGTTFAAPVVFQNCRFEDRLDLSAARLDAAVSFEGCVFQRPVTLRSARCSGDLTLYGSIFNDALDLRRSHIGGTLEMSRCRFTQSKARTRLNGMEVGYSLLAHACHFAGPLDLAYAHVASNLELNGSKLDSWISLGSARVGQLLRLNGIFLGKNADFEFVSTGGNFELGNARTSPGARISLNTLKSGGSIRLDRSRLDGPVDLRYAEARLVLNLSGTEITGLLDLTGTEVGSLRIDPHTRTSRVETRAFAYRTFLAGSDDRSWGRTLQFVESANFAAEPYTRLAQYLEGRGRKGDADWVVFRQNWVEMERATPWYLKPFRCATGLLIGFGRYPWLAFLWSSAFILYGWWLYRDGSRMIARSADDQGRTYNSFWYSMSLFLPFVDLDASSVWRPDEGRARDFRQRWRLLYMRIHILLGWILIPIGLAAITGLIR